MVAAGRRPPRRAPQAYPAAPAPAWGAPQGATHGGTTHGGHARSHAGHKSFGRMLFSVLSRCRTTEGTKSAPVRTKAPAAGPGLWLCARYWD